MQQYRQLKQVKNLSKKLAWGITAGCFLVTLFGFTAAHAVTKKT